MNVWHMLSTGPRSLDWSGLGLAVELYGVTDVEGLLGRLLVIKSHKPAKAD